MVAAEPFKAIIGYEWLAVLLRSAKVCVCLWRISLAPPGQCRLALLLPNGHLLEPAHALLVVIGIEHRVRDLSDHNSCRGHRGIRHSIADGAGIRDAKAPLRMAQLSTLGKSLSLLWASPIGPRSPTMLLSTYVQQFYSASDIATSSVGQSVSPLIDSGWRYAQAQPPLLLRLGPFYIWR